MVRDAAVVGASLAIALALSGCDTPWSGTGNSCFQVAFDNGELPLTANGTEIDYSFSCKAGFQWDASAAPEIECSWVGKECLISDNASCQNVFDFTKKGEGLTAWPEGEEPSMVDEFSQSILGYLEALNKKEMKKTAKDTGSLKESASALASKAKETVSSAASKTKETLSSAASKAKETASSAASSAKETASSAASKAKETRASSAASSAKETASSAASKAKETASAAASKAKETVGDGEETAGDGEETAGDGEDTSAEEGRRLALPKSISPEDLKSACKPAGNATAKFQVFGSSALIQSNSVSSVVFGAFAATIALAVGCVVHSKLAARSHRVRLSETESDESIDGFVE
eukprot:TRINITY_DN648_c0_g1_i10.p1 TRINITY_DN648_c0_g1~~TRINITY_DN648_c0_g1_i10.p1  ORF type:complete len:350 (+),score=76.09 TRINITY_DN648_c0_g1_i10:58-1107(+)